VLFSQRHPRAPFDQPNAGLRRDKRALHAVQGEAEVVREDSQKRPFSGTHGSVY